VKIAFVIAVIVGCLLLFACSGGTEVAPDDTVSFVNELPGVPEEASQEGTSHESQQAPDAPESTPFQEPDNDSESEAALPATGEVIISFEYTKQSGPASNQHAVWIEDLDGRLIKSLFASRWTANGGFATRPDSIALWAERADLANMSSADVDAVAGATPGTGLLSYTWDLTDLSGETILQGDYVFYVEGTLRWKNFVLVSGIITIADDPVTVQGNAVFHYEGSDRYDALTADSVENNMIGAVTAVFVP